mmetsp:Transcript_12259/g.36209  ORF Transcript_12259/g.36209 Transcript_12259/m.36209 type:complete len:283 (-) Transcript_12259:142-990(-)
MLCVRLLRVLLLRGACRRRRLGAAAEVAAAKEGEPEENCEAKGDPLADEEVGVDKVSELLVARAEDALGRVELAERAAARLGRPPRGGGVALEEVCVVLVKVLVVEGRLEALVVDGLGDVVEVAVGAAQLVWRRVSIDLKFICVCHAVAVVDGSTTLFPDLLDALLQRLGRLALPVRHIDEFGLLGEVQRVRVPEEDDRARDGGAAEKEAKQHVNRDRALVLLPAEGQVAEERDEEDEGADANRDSRIPIGHNNLCPGEGEREDAERDDSGAKEGVEEGRDE